MQTYVMPQCDAPLGVHAAWCTRFGPSTVPRRHNSDSQPSGHIRGTPCEAARCGMFGKCTEQHTTRGVRPIGVEIQARRRRSIRAPWRRLSPACLVSLVATTTKKTWNVDHLVNYMVRVLKAVRVWSESSVNRAGRRSIENRRKQMEEQCCSRCWPLGPSSMWRRELKRNAQSSSSLSSRCEAPDLRTGLLAQRAAGSVSPCTSRPHPRLLHTLFS